MELLCAMTKVNFILFIILIASLNILAGETPKLLNTKTVLLSGKVLDKNNNEFLAGVKINYAGLSKTVYTDLYGNFLVFIEMKADDDFNVEFSQIGYSSKLISIKELAGHSSNYQVELIEE